MSAIDNVVLAPGTTRLPNDIKLYGSIQVTMDNKFGTGTRIGNIRLPDFNKSTEMLTKTQPSKSDEELKEAIVKMARENAEKGHFQDLTKEFFDLRKEYISSASPDRKSIITDSVKQIDGIKQILKKANSPEEAKSLLQLLMEKEKGKAGNYGKLSIEGDKLSYVEFYGGNGEMIATYDSNNGWMHFLTKEEETRKLEFYSIYNETWRNATDEMNAQNNPSTPKYLEGGTTIDSYA